MRRTLLGKNVVFSALALALVACSSVDNRVIGNPNGVLLFLRKDSEFRLGLSISAKDYQNALAGEGNTDQVDKALAAWKARGPDRGPIDYQILASSGQRVANEPSARNTGKDGAAVGGAAVGVASAAESTAAQHLATAAVAAGVGLVLINTVVPIKFDPGIGWDTVISEMYATPEEALGLFGGTLQARATADGIKFEPIAPGDPSKSP